MCKILHLILVLLGVLLPLQAQENIWANTERSLQVELTPYLASGQNRPAVVVCPGGSYFWHDMYDEGHGVGRWLQQHGISAFVLKYRTAKAPAFVMRYRLVLRGNRYPDPQDDLRQALRYVRLNAQRFGVDARRVGAIGFSAGGHLVMSSVELFDRSDWPAFVVPVYPVVSMSAPCTHKRSRRGLLGDSRKGNARLRDLLSLERHVPDGCPPVFLVSCQDDPVVDPENAVLLDSALTARSVPHVFLQYPTGGHGFGVSPVKGSAECRQWKDELLKWINRMYDHDE